MADEKKIPLHDVQNITKHSFKRRRILLYERRKFHKVQFVLQLSHSQTISLGMQNRIGYVRTPFRQLVQFLKSL